MRAAFYTLGCKVNQYETQILQQHFLAGGYEIVDFDGEADVYVVNSCTVTANGDRKTRQMLRGCLNRNPKAVVALTGCFPQAYPDAAENIPEAQVITGSYNRKELLALVQRALVTGERVVEVTPHRVGEPFEFMSADKFLEHTRAFVKIEDGCDRYCSYCIIPTARGPIRSKSLKDLEAELYSLAQNGYREVVLVGINLSSFGRDTGGKLTDAVELACHIPGIERVRLGSLEPELLTDQDIKRLAGFQKLCPQFHLSLQSGSDGTLKRMNRHYDAAEYARIVASFRRYFENPAFTTDMMVGFPGETEEEFAESLSFAQKIGFAKVHVFSYSIRPGTKAAGMAEQVPKQIKARRSETLSRACGELREAFLDSQVGKTCQVLFETYSERLGYHGYTENYTPVYVQSDEPLEGQIRSVLLTGSAQDYCIGELR